MAKATPAPTKSVEPQRDTVADPHAVLVTGSGTFTPSGLRIDSRPITDAAMLGRLLNYLAKTSRDPRARFGLRSAGRSGQLWIVGAPALEALGWFVDPGEQAENEPDIAMRRRTADLLTKHLAPDLEVLAAHGWVLREDGRQVGHRIGLVQAARDPSAPGGGAKPLMVDVILAPYAWTMGVRDKAGHEDLGVLGRGDNETGSGLPDEEMPAAAELGRRLAWCVRNLKTLPGTTGADTGAAIYDKIKRDRQKRAEAGAKRVAVAVDTAGPLPPLSDAPQGDIEPPLRWTSPYIRDIDINPVVDPTTNRLRLVMIDQVAAYLASMGMVMLGYGAATQFPAAEALDGLQAGLSAGLPPFGVWQLTVPPLKEVLPDWAHRLPPHSRWTDPVQPTTLWVTTEGLCGTGGLLSATDQGGAGLKVEQLKLHQAWLTPNQATVLDTWQETVAGALKLSEPTGAAPDPAMEQFCKRIYRGYVGRMSNPDMWTNPWMTHHHQRLWYEAIHAHCANRTRRKAAEIKARTKKPAVVVDDKEIEPAFPGLDPWRAVVDALVFAPPPGVDITDPPRPGGGAPPLGRMRVVREVWVPGPYEAEDGLGWQRLFLAQGSIEIAKAIDTCLMMGVR